MVELGETSRWIGKNISPRLHSNRIEVGIGEAERLAVFDPNLNVRRAGQPLPRPLRHLWGNVGRGHVPSPANDCEGGCRRESGPGRDIEDPVTRLDAARGQQERDEV